MSKQASAKIILKAAGLTVAVERDAVIGYQYAVERDGRSLCSGWSSGNKAEAYEAALTDVRDRGLLGATEAV